MEKHVFLVALLLTAAQATGGTALAATPTNTAELASALQGQRDQCAKAAKEVKDAYSLAQYQAGLDRQTAALKAKMDSRVYAVGHGSRETTQYYIQQMQNADNAQNSKDKATSATFDAGTRQVVDCVSNAEQQGKAMYSEFKKHHVNKSVGAEAEVLMTAWLTNVSEISTSSPNGSDASYASWKTAKTHAEVSAL